MNAKKAVKDVALFFELALRAFVVLVLLMLTFEVSGFLAFLGYAAVAVIVLTSPPRIVEALKL